MKIYKNCFFLFLIIASTHDSATAVAEKDDTRTAAIAARSRRKTRNEKDIGLDGLAIQQHERKKDDDSTSYYYDDELEIRRDLNTDQVFQFSCTGHACLVAYDMVQCVGYNYYGQLGQSSSATFGTPIQLNFPNTITAKPKKVVTGYDHTCTLFDDGYVWCNGSNGFQQLGIGVSGNSATPVQVKKGVDVLTNVIDIEAGAYHNCAIQNTGAMYCWGFDEQGQLGMNAIIDGMTDDKKATKMALSMISTCVITGTEANPNKFATCVGKGFTSENVVSTTIDLVNDVLKLTAGSDHFCALLVGDTAKCWGANNAGQLGIGSNDFIPRHDTAVNVLVSPGTSVLSGITDINAGYLSTCLVANGSPMCFGNNRSYQLGIANGGANVLYPTVVSSAQITDKTLISIHVGEQTGHAIYNDDSIYSMGTNYGGALGDGSIVSFRNVVGDVSGATISQMNFSSATIDQSSSPSNIPSLQPSSTPSLLPSSSPVTSPSSIPSLIPSDIPSIQDSSSPSSSVSVKPSINLSSGPSSYPSESPSMSSDKPSSSPSLLPSDMPSLQHSSSPSLLPSETPSLLHSSTPTSTPSALPSLSPSSNPSQDPYLLGDENSHITFNDIDFGSTNSVKGIKITYANGEVNSSGSVEVKLGDASGTTIAQFTPVGTNTWVDVSNIMLIPFDNTVQLSGVNSLTFTTSETTAAILLISYQLIDLSERYTPFTTIPATEVSTCSGVFASGDIIGAFDNGDYFTYSPIDFGSGANSIKITYAKGTTSGSFEIRKGDHETGEIIGTYSPASTGTSWGTFVTAEIPIQTSYGIDQLTFRGTSSNGGIMNLKSFQLSPVSAGYICLDSNPRTYTESVKAAVTTQTGANLVSIRCSAQQIAVHSLTRDLNVYIGGTDVDNEGVWVLPDGNAVTYSNWAPGHPDGSDVENCVVIKANGNWNDVECGRLRGSIFESTFEIPGLQCAPYVGCQDTVKIVENGIQTSDTLFRNNNLVTQSDTTGAYLSVPGSTTATSADNWNVYNLPIGANDDFLMLAKLKVDGSGSAASFFINDLDNFGFDGSSYQIVNHLFTHSNSAFITGFVQSNKGTHHDNLFYFKIERKLGTIKFYINEEEVASIANYNVAISRFYWRPWRANLKIYEWTVASPSNIQTVSPTSSPTSSPTKAPTPAPTSTPTSSPTKAPTPLPTSSPTTPDPAGYICLQSQLLSFSASAQVASSNGGRLVAIRCSEQNAKVQSFKTPHTYWIGGNDIDNEGTWVLSDGYVASYSNWSSGEPDNGGGIGDCLRIGSTGYWNDGSCEWGMPAVYESSSPIDGMTCTPYVECPPINVALSTNGAIATQSSTYNIVPRGASLAIDGNTNGIFNGGSVTHTNSETAPWWKVQLPREYSISRIIVYNRSDDCCIHRLNNFKLTVMCNNAVVFTYNDSASTAQAITTIPIEPNVIGDEVKIQTFNSLALSLAEVVVEASPSAVECTPSSSTYFDGVHLTNYDSTKCIGYDGHKDLFMHTCDGGVAQQFELTSNGLIVWGGLDNMCLLADGTDVLLWPKLRACDGLNQNQLWTYENGQFKTAGGTKCLGIFDTGNRLKVDVCASVTWYD